MCFLKNCLKECVLHKDDENVVRGFQEAGLLWVVSHWASWPVYRGHQVMRLPTHPALTRQEAELELHSALAACPSASEGSPLSRAKGLASPAPGLWPYTSPGRKWKVKVAQSCPTLCDPMDYTVPGILQATILERAAFPFSRESSQPMDRTQVSCIAGGFFTIWATREAPQLTKPLQF